MTAKPAAPRRRDAAETKQLLLEAARRRFAEAGYGTTVRDIADDAGVNIALISRYFRSKEGLFEACLTSAVDELLRTTGDVPLSRIPDVIAQQITGETEGLPNTLVLLLRSAGDDRADRFRRELLHSLSERLAATAGWQPGDDDLLLRAQVVLAASCGIALLRSTTAMRPLAATTASDLDGPLRDLVEALLPPPR